jgi:biotin transport system substrate-specific component
MTVSYMNEYQNVTYNFFKWRHELEFLHKVVLALTFACLTGLLAQARFYLPWSPVPVTAQTFAVLLSAVVLGRWGGVSQGIYVVLGIVGIPWFAGTAAGIGVLFGPTGGYLLGFIAAAFFLGHYFDRSVDSREFKQMLPLMSFASFVIIYGLGLVWLYGWLTFVTGISVSHGALLNMGATPFIAGDLVKILAAAGLGTAITPKQAFGDERSRV